MSEEHIVISSLVVETLPEYREELEAKLRAMDGVEIHGSEGGKIVITIECETTDESHERANEITTFEHVLAVNLIYVNFEDDAELQDKFDALQERAAQTSEALHASKAKEA